MTRRQILFGFLIFLIQLVYGQQPDDKMDVNFSDLPLDQVLDSITLKSGYYFSYNADALPSGSLYSLKRNQVTVDSLLTELLVGTGLEYLREDDQIILRRRQQQFTYKVLAGNTKKSTIRGWVRHKSNNEPVIGANVFLNGTTIGGVSDKNGNYLIKEIPPGTHQLIISYVGFETNSYQIKAYDGNTYVLNTFLNSKTTELPSIEITSLRLVDSSEWSHYFKQFNEEFIGFSSNSYRCKIENPQVIGFTYDSEQDVLKAYAEEPIMVLNYALGYRVQCQLASFERNGKVTRFHIRAFFEELDYQRKGVARRWKRNRKLTYEGSSPHFFRSLIEDRVDREGFQCFLIQNGRNVEVGRADILSKDSIGYNWRLDFDSTLIVRYSREVESIEYLNYIHEEATSSANLSGRLPSSPGEPGDQISMLELSKKPVILFSNGQLQNPEHVVRLGYWSWERLADLMPVNFDPKK